jgi:hypothetical protein
MGVDPVMALLADRQPVGYDGELGPDPASAMMDLISAAFLADLAGRMFK